MATCTRVAWRSSTMGYGVQSVTTASTTKTPRSYVDSWGWPAVWLGPIMSMGVVRTPSGWMKWAAWETSWPSMTVTMIVTVVMTAATAKMSESSVVGSLESYKITATSPWDQWLNSLVPTRCGVNFKTITFKLIMEISGLDTRCKIARRWMPQTAVNPLMRRRHWFRWWLGATRQQAIIWANVDPDQWRPKTLSDHEI